MSYQKSIAKKIFYDKIRICVRIKTENKSDKK